MAHHLMRILVTGGAGFVGSAVIRHLIGRTEHRVLNLDKLTYAASLESLAGVADDPRYGFLKADICDAAAVRAAFRAFQPDAVMHVAAETHVDRSIDSPTAFLHSNVVGTVSLLEAARAYWAELDGCRRAAFRFHAVSTDEVFGALAKDADPFDEGSRYRPRSPYAASKAASDHFVQAWGHTYGLPVLLTNAGNSYGPYQFPEKLIPLTIVKALHGEALPVYGRGEQIRDWLHVEDHAAALVRVVEAGTPGETFLIGGGTERRNIDVVQAVAALADQLAPPLRPGKSRQSLITFVEDRPGHDFRYAANPAKIRAELGWQPAWDFDGGLADTVAWYLANEAWWAPLLERYHGERLGLPAEVPAEPARRRLRKSV